MTYSSHFYHRRRRISSFIKTDKRCVLFIFVHSGLISFNSLVCLNLAYYSVGYLRYVIDRIVNVCFCSVFSSEKPTAVGTIILVVLKVHDNYIFVTYMHNFV